jgi:hypothetical protein
LKGGLFAPLLFFIFVLMSDPGKRIKNLLKKHGLSGVNKPKRTPSHATKKGVVLAKVGDKIRLIRFGDQKMGHNYSKGARKSFKARHAANIAKGKMSAAYWANKLFWGGSGGSKKAPPKSQKKRFENGGTVDPPKKELAYKDLLSYIATAKNTTPEQIEDAMSRIIFHESKGDPTIKQKGGGPGRGAFQFEVGDGHGGIIAINRAYNLISGKDQSHPDLMDYNAPDWIKGAYPEKSFDASTVSLEQQKYLFLMNQLAHPKADLGKLFSGEVPLVDYWADYHWAGKEKKRSERVKSFDLDMKAYDQLNTKQHE